MLINVSDRVFWKKRSKLVLLNFSIKVFFKNGGKLEEEMDWNLSSIAVPISLHRLLCPHATYILSFISLFLYLYFVNDPISHLFPKSWHSHLSPAYLANTTTIQSLFFGLSQCGRPSQNRLSPPCHQTGLRRPPSHPRLETVASGRLHCWGGRDSPWDAISNRILKLWLYRTQKVLFLCLIWHLPGVASSTLSI